MTSNWRWVIAVWLGFVSPGLASADVLDIEPVYQETPVWCWAAVGEMVFRYYGVGNINPVGNFQCGIIALVHPICNQNCGNCLVPAGSLSTMERMLNRYPQVAGQVTRTDARISTSSSHRSLSFTEVRDEIDAGRPIVAGISPSGYRQPGISEHVALIVGYDGDSLIVNDPFPFAAAFAGDPYESAGGESLSEGQYRIDYTAFRRRLQWQESIYSIRCSGSDCDETRTSSAYSSDENDNDDYADDDDRRSARYGRSCQTPVMRCGPFYNQDPLPVGSTCYCGTPYGPSYGTVVPP